MIAPRATLLIVEDEGQIRRIVRAALESEGYAVLEASTCAGGLSLADEVELVILDLGLPDRDGFDFLRQLRTWSAVPVLVLTARSGENEKVLALDGGADDYLTKPFGMGELLARVRALLRRREKESDEGPVKIFGSIRVDLANRTVTREGVPVHLTQIEFRLLAVLLANGGKVLTHRFLLREVWGPAFVESNHYLRIYVGRLRQKLESDPTQPKHILTETGVGYRFQF